MPSRNNFLIGGLLVTSAWAAPVFHYQIAGERPGGWPRILSSAGLVRGAGGITVVTGSAATQDTAAWLKRVEEGAVLAFEGESAIAEAFGFVADRTRRPVPTQSVTDSHNPKLSIVWEHRLDVPHYRLPAQAIVFTRERWDGAPLMAGVKHGLGAALWLAVPPGDKGHERFPYAMQALADLGARPGLESRELWAFFDASYRSRVDLDYFAARWRRSGISALHVAAWHFFDPDPQKDEYLRRLIDACHRQAILVYAWLEFPHVSEKFWNDHPEWREKTAIGQDAHLDWRRLMNLRDPGCAKEVAAGTVRLFDRFNWDGINLAELYFESLEGAANPARFTPMNPTIRGEFEAAHGFDPQSLFGGARSKDAPALRTFLDWRADLVRRLQEDWIAEMEKIRARQPHLGLVLTHVDDRYDTRMRDLIGADAARLLPMLGRLDFTFLIEDPATVWHLGPDRYPEIARRYEPLTPRTDKLAIDINIVERYQDVYPTKQQTGTELFQLVNLATRAFARVALYFENSILNPDVPLLAASAAAPDRVERTGRRFVVESKRSLGVPAPDPVTVNGRLWPFWDGVTAWLPPGAHVLEAAAAKPLLRLIDFNGRLRSMESLANGFEFSYSADARAWAVFDPAPARIEVDERSIPPGTHIAFPRGQHLVKVLGHAAVRAD
jgi:hypothetical protein